jgi:hypothetical protein
MWRIREHCSGEFNDRGLKISASDPAIARRRCNQRARTNIARGRTGRLG